jgi:hypothetical protein
VIPDVIGPVTNHEGRFATSTKFTKSLKDYSLQPFHEDRHSEIDWQAAAQAGGFQIRDDLPDMDAVQSNHRFEFDNNQPSYNEIDPLPRYFDTTIGHADRPLHLVRKTSRS